MSQSQQVPSRHVTPGMSDCDKPGDSSDKEKLQAKSAWQVPGLSLHCCRYHIRTSAVLTQEGDNHYSLHSSGVKDSLRQESEVQVILRSKKTHSTLSSLPLQRPALRTETVSFTVYQLATRNLLDSTEFIIQVAMSHLSDRRQLDFLSTSHEVKLITFLPFVHTARLCYRLNESLVVQARKRGVTDYEGVYVDVTGAPPRGSEPGPYRNSVRFRFQLKTMRDEICTHPLARVCCLHIPTQAQVSGARYSATETAAPTANCHGKPEIADRGKGDSLTCAPSFFAPYVFRNRSKTVIPVESNCKNPFWIIRVESSRDPPSHFPSPVHGWGEQVQWVLNSRLPTIRLQPRPSLSSALVIQCEEPIVSQVPGIVNICEECRGI
ncbi:hypothetical protein J6590_038665 [Homalodisca vitripennis]|nr:hypothetical protein J6590_038665 [Homalodisca vitripennis]